VCTIIIVHHLLRLIITICSKRVINKTYEVFFLETLPQIQRICRLLLSGYNGEFALVPGAFNHPTDIVERNIGHISALRSGSRLHTR